MIHGRIFLAVLLTSSCAPSESEQAVLSLAETELAMPDCKSAKVNWAFQKIYANRTIVHAQISADEKCLEAWDRQLAETELKPQLPHGEWVFAGKYDNSEPPQ
ncbi:MAG: hypothetical protein KJO02_01360, partial [Erythrobacter sp.]|nr:hypothetical protein [Erythrobacter sp.]